MPKLLLGVVPKCARQAREITTLGESSSAEPRSRKPEREKFFFWVLIGRNEHVS